MERASGILLSVSSLPSPYGIGTLGKAAYDFADFLAQAGQRYWQMLPVGPISYGDSPYQSFSAFAGNPYYIDLDFLAADGLLTAEEIAACPWGDDPARVDYGAVYAARFPLLEKAFDRGWERDKAAVTRFLADNRSWLPDYALFMALKRHFNMAPWTDWPDEDIRLRQRDAVAAWAVKLDRDVRFFTYLQYLFQMQWDALKAYCAEKGVATIGDLPIYVAMDSADVWASPKNFRLDEKNVPTAVAGVPPDAFTADGQLWGNPLYDWERMEADGFSWWEARLRRTLELFDVARLDHFRGLESYWAVPYGDKTAAGGRWEPGPGMAFVKMLRERFPDSTIIAEDLGFITPPVRALLEASGCPGMRVLEFAFSDPGNAYLPHNYKPNCVCYTGTHDNDTAVGWYTHAGEAERAFVKQYLGAADAESARTALLRCGQGSVAELFVAQMQDYLGLGSEARINVPGVGTGNWRWRLLPGQVTEALAKEIREMTHTFGRC